MVLHSVRSDRFFCKPVGSHRPWIRFLDLDFQQGSFNHSVFAKKSERVLWAEVAGLLGELDALSRPQGRTGEAPYFAVAAYHLL